MITTPPLIQTGLLAQFLAAFIMIAVAIFVEHGGTNKTSVAVNILGLSFMLISTGIDVFVLPLLIVYLMVGLVAFFREIRKVFFLFSSRSYGSLMLAIAFLHTSSIQNFLPTIQVVRVWWVDLTFASNGLILISWFLTIPIIYLLAYVIGKRIKHSKRYRKYY